MKYSDLPSDYYNPLGDKIANQWDNEFNLIPINGTPQPRLSVWVVDHVKYVQ